MTTQQAVEKTKEIEDLRKWVHEELEPYFQGEFGTMDTMLEMFIEQLTDKLSSLIDEEKGEALKRYLSLSLVILP